MFFAIVTLAIQSIFRNKVRSFLTMLGIIIGVGSVVLLTSIGNGLQAYVSDQFESLGSNTIYVVPGKPFGEGGGFGGNQEQTLLETTKTTLKLNYLRQILRNQRSLISRGAATNLTIARVKYLKTEKKVTLLGVSASYPIIQSAEASKGKWFTEIDDKKASAVVLLGKKAAEELFGEIDPVGKRIQLESQTYTVLGVLKERGGGFGGPSFDNYIYLPFNTVVERFNVQYIDNFVLTVRDVDKIPEAKNAVKKELAIALNRDLFELLVAQLKSLGFDVTTLVTSHILPFEVPATGITPALALEAIKAWGRLESHDFLEPEQKKGMISSREQQDPGERNRIYMLVGVFVVLILLLGGVIFYSMQQSKKDQEAAAALKAEMAQKAAEEAAVVPSIAPTVEPTAVPGQLTPELAAARAKYSITVYEPTTPVIEADAVVTALEEAGFSKVRTISNYAAATSALRITVDDTVSSQDRLGLKDILAAFDSSVNIKTVTGSEANIVIVLPK